MTTAGVECGPLQERRQIRCLIVFERTRTHREGILTPGRRLGQRPAAPLAPRFTISGRPAFFLAPRPVRCFAFGLPRLHACAGLTLRPTAPSKLLLEGASTNTFALSSLRHIDTRVGYTTPSRVMYHSRRDQADTLPCCTPAAPC